MDSIFYIALGMPGTAAWVALAVAVLLLFASAAISGSEVAFFSLSPKDIERLEDGENDRDTTIGHLLEKSERLMAAILIGNNLVNVAIIMLFSLFINGCIDHNRTSTVMIFLIETVILTFLLLLFGEVLPKVYASHRQLSFARATAPVMDWMTRAFSPFISLLVGSTGIINRRLADKMGEEVTVEDLADAMKLTPQVAHNKDEKKMLEGIIEFADKTVKDAMTSRSEMTTVDVKSPFSEVLKLVVDQRYSRIPVFEETEDHIRGILYIKDLLPYLNQNDQFRWQDLIRTAYYVPENKMIDDLLDDFRKKRLHMAIVVDEFGGTSGLITMEDVLEEIVGEIRDEYDEDEQTWQKVGKDEWIFEARTSLTDFCRAIAFDADQLGDKADNCESVGGLLLEIKQNFPKVNETIRYRGIEFLVLSMDRRRIDRIRVTVKRKS
ncbi:MAG: gliding motility-associated protein GldE [Bacteroidales bacterium]|nr:gliding motility-associated protein GldE [Candidatus Liminaster caballi]